jgi:hypothetical protein
MPSTERFTNMRSAGESVAMPRYDGRQSSTWPRISDSQRTRDTHWAEIALKGSHEKDRNGGNRAIVGMRHEKDENLLTLTAVRQRSFADGGVLFSFGQSRPRSYVLRSGAVGLTRPRSDGESDHMATAVGQRFLGELAALHGSPHMATATAVGACLNDFRCVGRMPANRLRGPVGREALSLLAIVRADLTAIRATLRMVRSSAKCSGSLCIDGAAALAPVRGALRMQHSTNVLVCHRADI